ncbi:MAG: 16S rRNA (cytosine(967)-C(5))-methyltransferase RsmB, partial [Clostridium sp.]
YQIYYMDRVPDSAVCNEAVRLAKKRGFQGLSGFVNGVLRAIVRGKETLIFPDDSIRCSMPAWILERWEKEQGKEAALRMAEASLAERPMTVGLYTAYAEKDEILTLLKEQGVCAKEVLSGSGVYELSGVDYPESLLAFQKGFLRVQDLSSSLAGDAAGLQPGDFVLDVCGAPGGKGLHAAELLCGTGMVEIRDVSSKKIAMIEENIVRSGCKNARAVLWDARIKDASMVERADAVLADLPCSGLGIIGRKPDIKYNASPEGISSLAALQREILSVVWQYVKPGGTLVYSTCTVSREENEKNRDWFLERFPFEPVDLTGRLGDGFSEKSLQDGYIQLLPGIHPCDGFFIAVMRRKKK